MRSQHPPVLSIAGSDNSAGAGLQADLKTISANGCYGLTAATCVVAEIPGRVSGIQPVRASLLSEQIRLCFDAFPVAAVKTGMLYSASLVEVVADELERAKKRGGEFKLVVDPVMIASSGDALLRPGAVRIYRERIFPMADVVTPNLDELGFLIGRTIDGLAEMGSAGKEMAEKYGTAFLLKGGHLQGEEAVDLLVRNGKVTKYSAPYIQGAETHGTGCTYSSAIACGLASGRSMERSVKIAKQYITRAIEARFQWGETSALRHFF